MTSSGSHDQSSRADGSGLSGFDHKALSAGRDVQLYAALALAFAGDAARAQALATPAVHCGITPNGDHGAVRPWYIETITWTPCGPAIRESFEG